MPKITIITPTYNSSKFIKRTIDSVLAQTYTDWEFLLIDDHSTDNTVEIISEYAKKDPRIKILSTPKNSGGPALPKNIGIENAIGEYVAFLDHDDQWLAEKLEKQLKVFTESKNEKLGLVACYINVANNEGKILYRHKENYRGSVIGNLARGNFIVTSSCVITKSEVYKKCGLFDVRFKTSDDWDMWLRIAEISYDFDFVPEFLINYIIHGGNAYLENKNRNDEKEFLLLYGLHTETFKKYSLKATGHYYLYKKEYGLARGYFIKSIFSKGLNFNQKIKSCAFVILTFFPNLEFFLRKVFFYLKKLIK